MSRCLTLMYSIVLDLVKQGNDQRDYYYFMGLGHYKLEVGNMGMVHGMHPGSRSITSHLRINFVGI